LRHLAEKADVRVDEVVGADLEVVDLQPPALGGVNEELLFSPRIDNLAGCHALLDALIRSDRSQRRTRIIALFDSEEIGSQTSGGAGSSFLDSVLERICLTHAQPREAWHRALAHSMLISVDGAHAVHPSYADFHDPHHRPILNGGPVLKINAQQRYATNASTRCWFEYCARRAGVPLQYYVHRTDLPCGSTIGPMTATRLGVPVVDVGSPMLSMHSIRETGGVEDQHRMIQVLMEHFSN
ncbi:MAG: M18 family aminopeptidase, partial [Candidatus Eisenbacteria sp.]|nr:M18 family aminopeptidase [Candidatus Eisenbacteria bacterium]